MLKRALTIYGLGLLAIPAVEAAVPVDVEVIPSSMSQIRRAIQRHEVLVARNPQVPVEVFTVLYLESGAYTCDIYATHRMIRDRWDVIQQQKQVCYERATRRH